MQDSRDWTCKEGIKVAGRQLFHVKCRSCRGQMKYPKCVHGARYNKPLSEEYPGFEVLIYSNISMTRTRRFYIYDATKRSKQVLASISLLISYRFMYPDTHFTAFDIAINQ